MLYIPLLQWYGDDYIDEDNDDDDDIDEDDDDDDSDDDDDDEDNLYHCIMNIIIIPHHR